VTAALDPVAPLALLQQAGVVTPTSLNLPAKLDEDEFRAICIWLGGLRDWSAWSIGDAILYAESVSDELAEEVVELFGRAKSTLLKWSWLCRSYAPNQRIVGVSPTHHELVATLPAGERRAWLLQAKREGLSVEEFRGLVRTEPVKVPVQEVPVGSAVQVHLRDGKHEMQIGTAVVQADGTAVIQQVDHPAVIDALPAPLERAWRAATKAARSNGNGHVLVPDREWSKLSEVLG
jgi:hypothetical protein